MISTHSASEADSLIQTFHRFHRQSLLEPTQTSTFFAEKSNCCFCICSILPSLYCICTHFPPLEFTLLSAFKRCAGLAAQSCHCNSLKENQSRAEGDQTQIILMQITLPPPSHRLSDFLFLLPFYRRSHAYLTKIGPLIPKCCCCK